MESVPPGSMRYRTCGDWVLEDDHLLIQVADSGNDLYNLLVGIHELIEVMLCANEGISQEAVDEFDFKHEDDPDPGSHPESPYQREHLTAFGIEMVLAAALGLNWRDYEDSIEKTLLKTPLKST